MDNDSEPLVWKANSLTTQDDRHIVCLGYISGIGTSLLANLEAAENLSTSSRGAWWPYYGSYSMHSQISVKR